MLVRRISDHYVLTLSVRSWKVPLMKTSSFGFVFAQRSLSYSASPRLVSRKGVAEGGS